MAIARKNSKTRTATSTNRPTTAKKGKAAPRTMPRPGDDDEHDAQGDGDPAQRSTPLGLEIDDEVLEFIDALDRFKKSNNRPFPGWSEVLFVLKELGYRKA